MRAAILQAQVTDRGGVVRVDRDRAGQRYPAAGLRRVGPQLVIERGGDGHRVRAARAPVVQLVPVIAQRRPRARFHFDIRHVRRRVGRLLCLLALLVVRVRFAGEIRRCQRNNNTQSSTVRIVYPQYMRSIKKKKTKFKLKFIKVCHL